MDMKQALFLSTMRPIYTPRTAMSKYIRQLETNKTNLAINIDKETLLLFKDFFEDHDNTVVLLEFISIGMKVLKSWQKDLSHRQMKIIKYLLSLFNEIQNKDQDESQCLEGLKNKKANNNETIPSISWEQFNNLIIEKSLNLKSLQTQEAELVSLLKNSPWRRDKAKLQSPVQKILCLNSEKKLAYLCEESNTIEFMSLYGSNPQTYRPLVLEKHDLVVQKSLVKRVKDESGKKALPKKEVYKKDVVVSAFKVTFLDMIYLESEKYKMLLTSSSDGVVRGWDIRGSSPVLMRQPENEDEKMIHHFPVQIHYMAWDDINQILYCTGKDAKIYMWLIKTDSERELYDADAHSGMISSIIMMPKLQFLATGGYDGKLVLWDTISLNKKFKYEEHTRSIISMTFHESLILLFTASFDHSICVWNPYIPSLIYKIPCNINVLQVSIIPNTNYLISLDCSSNLKIREVNKFNLISTFVVDRPDDNEANKIEQENSLGEEKGPIRNEGVVKIEPVCMGISENPTQIFFGGNSVKCMEFDENESLTASEYFPTKIKYLEQKKRLFVSIKNNILVWDMLTGQLFDSLSRQTDQEITTIELIDKTGNFVLGDIQGNILLRKQESGVRVSKLYQNKYKAPILHLLAKQGGIWNDSVIIGCCQDCEIPIFGRDESNDFIHLRTLNPRKSYPKISIQAIEYENRRNILMIGTNSGDIIFMDVDKNKVTNYIQGTSIVEVVYFNLNYSAPSVLAFKKSNQIFGVYLPPHSKKFKPFCSLEIVSDLYDQQKISTVAMCSDSKTAFLGYENGGIKKISISDANLQNSEIQFEKTNNKEQVNQQWSIYFEEPVKDIILVEKQTVLILILHMKNIAVISAESGDIINSLPSHAFLGNSSATPFHQEDPVAFFKEESMEIYVRKNNKSYPILTKEELNGLSQTEQKQFSLKLSHDPFYLHEQYLRVIKKEQKEKKTESMKKQKQSQKKRKTQKKETITNLEQSLKEKEMQKEKEEKVKRVYHQKQWNFEPELKTYVEKNMQRIWKLFQQLTQFDLKPKKRIMRNNSTSAIMGNHSIVEKAYGVQKKWEKAKEDLEDEQGKTKSKLLPNNFKITHPKKMFQSKDKSQTLPKHTSLHHAESSPMFRLGMALQQIDDRDQKATKFMQLAEHQKKIENNKLSLKFPKIRKS